MAMRGQEDCVNVQKASDWSDGKVNGVDVDGAPAGRKGVDFWPVTVMGIDGPSKGSHYPILVNRKNPPSLQIDQPRNRILMGLCWIRSVKERVLIEMFKMRFPVEEVLYVYK